MKPILRPYDPIGTTRHVDFDTIKATYTTNTGRSHVSHGHGEFGRCDYLEIRDPWDAKNEIRTALPRKSV